MNKRTVSLLLLAAMLTSLAACGGDSPAPAGTTAADTADTTAAPEELTDGRRKSSAMHFPTRISAALNSAF